MILPKRIIAL